ncbi:MAG: outer membrane beta-barrel protein [Gammaproteobacteria bacterium]|jgi:hypothetical protein
MQIISQLIKFVTAASILLPLSVSFAHAHEHEEEDEVEAFENVYILAGATYNRIDESHLGAGSDDYATEPFGNEFGLDSGGNVGWRAGIGTRLTEMLALEFNYFGVANIEDSKSYVEYHEFSGGPSESYAIDADLTTSAMSFFDLSGVGRFDLDEDFWGFLRVGIAYAITDRKMTGTTQAIDDSTNKPVDEPVPFTTEYNESGFGVAVGIGAQYDFEPIGIRVEANTVQAENDISMYAIGANLVYEF